MATQELSTTPVNVVSTLGLDTGTRYLAQADSDQAGDSPVHITQSAATPDDLHSGYKIRHLEAVIIKPDGTNGIWAWVPEGRRRGVLRVEVAV